MRSRSDSGFRPAVRTQLALITPLEKMRKGGVSRRLPRVIGSPKLSISMTRISQSRGPDRWPRRARA